MEKAAYFHTVDLREYVRKWRRPYKLDTAFDLVPDVNYILTLQRKVLYVDVREYYSGDI